MKLGSKLLLYLFLIISALLIIFPLVFAVFASFMSSDEIYTGAFIPSKLLFENYKEAFAKVPLLKFLKNSFVVSTTVMIGQLIVSSMAAYAFVFVRFRGSNLIFFIFLSTMMIPWEATIIPNYLTILNLGLLDTYRGLSIPFFALAFGTFLLRQHFLTIPKEIFESAQMDGCGRFRFYLSFVLPLSRPALATLGIYGFLTTWNMYLWPLLVTNQEKVRTVQIGLKMMQAQETSTAWNMVMAGVVIVLLPSLLLLIFGLKHLKEGLTSGALKG